MKQCIICGKEIEDRRTVCSNICRAKLAGKKSVENRLTKGLPLFVKRNPKTKAKEGGWKCYCCSENFRTRREMQNHCHLIHPEFDGNKSNQYTRAKLLGLPIPKVSEEQRKKLSEKNKGRKFTEEQRKRLSNSMKKAHAEGRAWNIGKSRWNNKPSYPEKFFIEVINNDFEDKNYIREMPFHRYSLDFAWPHKKKCIEIDGEQHERFKEYKERDIKKDKLLLSESWEILRISWKEMYHDTKYWINIAKNFIGF